MNKEQLATVTDEYGNQMTTSPEAAALANLGSIIANGMRSILVSMQPQEEKQTKPSHRELGPQGQTNFISLGDGKKLWL